MRILVNREALRSVLRLFGNVVPVRINKPILTCILASAKNKRLVLTATDMEMTVQATLLQVDVSEDGEVAIPYEKLAGIADVSQSDTVTIKAEPDATISVKAGTSSFRIFTFSRDEFPPVGLAAMNGSMMIPASVLRSAIERTAFAAATEPTRYAIDGVLLEGSNKKFSMTATNGHRLAHVKVSLETPSDVKFKSIVPNRAVKVIRRAIQNDQNVRIQTEQNRLTLFILAEGSDEPHVIISTSLMEGNFPSYADVIPERSDHVFQIDRDAFNDALRQANVFIGPESKGMRFQCGQSDIEISARDPERGEAKVTLRAERTTGEQGGVLIGFNPEYVADFIGAAETKLVTLGLTTGNKAGLLRSGPDYVYVVMPVNLS